MASLFTITTPTNSVIIGPNRRGQAAFTVSNVSGRACRGRARISAQNPASSGWITLTGENERDFPIAGTQQYTVSVNVPDKAPAGNYPFRLDMVGVENPDEDFTQGPGMTFDVAAGGTKFPWWIVAVAAVVLLLVAGTVAALVLTRKATVPDMAGMSLATAQQALTSAGLKLGTTSQEDSSVVDKDLILRSDPAAGAKVGQGSTVNLVVSNGAVVQIDTLTPTPAAATLVPTDTSTAVPVPTLTNTPLPVDPSLIASYPMNNSLSDETGHYGQLVVHNAPFQETGVNCNGIYQNSGNASFCQVQTPSLGLLNFNIFSIAIRFKPTATNQMPVFMGGSNFRWIGYYLLANGHVALKFNNSNLLDCGLTYTPGTWYYGLISYDGVQAKLYLDGKLACTQPFTIVTGDDKDISVTDLSNGGTFNGLVSNLGIYNKLVIPISSVFNNGVLKLINPGLRLLFATPTP